MDGIIRKTLKKDLSVSMDSSSEKDFLGAFDELAPKLYRFCVLRTSSKELSEDLVSQSFMRAWEYLRSGQEIRSYPVFIYKGEKGNFYLVAVRGNGLWDKIWGTIALKDDFNTVVGASFGHVGETPGLGAEIKDNPNFSKQFQNKTIYDKDGKYVSVAVVKGGAKNPEHEVDAISGATMTSNGVSSMLGKGLAIYLPYFDSLKKK